MMARRAAALFFVFAAPGIAAAQTPATPPEPATAPRAQLGPVSFRPTLILRDVGIDSNVLNQPQAGQSDFTATLGARLDVGLRLPRVQGSYSTFYEYMYFAEAAPERGSNRGAEARVDALLGRFRPYVAGGISSSQERPTAEIDARARHQQLHAGAGLSAVAFSRTTLSVGYRHSGVDYAGDEQFRGIVLADELNGRTDTVTVGADLELTPLTTVTLHGARLEERFDASPERDADSYRLGITATLNPLALIAGRASIGLRTFRPLSPGVPEFVGPTAAIAVGYSFPDETRVNVTFDRDLRHSVLDVTPYYLSTGVRATLTRQMIERFDAQVFAGAERLAYKARLDGFVTPRNDTIQLVGTGVGYRLGHGGRVALNLEHTVRRSPADDREFSRTRLYTSVTYGL